MDPPIHGAPDDLCLELEALEEEPTMRYATFFFWHNARAQLGAFEGTETAALPTRGVEGQFSAALQT